MSTLYTACHKHDEFAHLSPDEIDSAIRHGAKMRKTSVTHNHRNHKGYNPDDMKALRVQCLGSLSEAAASKVLGLPIVLTHEVYNVPDLPGKVQVRLIGCESYGLRVYPKDDPLWRVVGVVIPQGHERDGRYRVPGWCWAREALSCPDWQMSPCGRPPMFCVPQSELRPISTLRAMVNGFLL